MYVNGYPSMMSIHSHIDATPLMNLKREQEDNVYIKIFAMLFATANGQANMGSLAQCYVLSIPSFLTVE